MSFRYSDDDNDSVPGFKKKRMAFFNPDRECIDDFAILLPDSDAMSQLLKDRKVVVKKELELFLRLRLEEETSKNEKQKINEDEKEAKPKLPLLRVNMIRKPFVTIEPDLERLSDIDFKQEKMQLYTQYCEHKSENSGESVEVYPWEEPLKIIENVSAKSIDPDKKERTLATYKILKSKGNLRKIATPKNKDTSELLSKLYESHPNFSPVIDFVREQFALSQAQNRPLHLQPILLFGDPGVGKTDFSKALAAILDVPIYRIGFDTGITDSTLTGSASHWGNTTPGVLFDKLVLGDVINPLFLLDEIDKSGGFFKDSRDPLKPLHTILEPATNEHVADISIGMEFNVSHVIWIATANNPSLVAMSLRSRFIEFQIEHPMGLDAIKLALTISKKVHKEMGDINIETIDLKLITLIAHLTPREQIQVLKRAYASAVARNKNIIEKSDFPIDVFIDCDDNHQLIGSHLH